MPKVTLYTAAAVFGPQGVFYLMETDIFVRGSFFRPIKFLAGAILFTLLAVWMIFASLDVRSER